MTGRATHQRRRGRRALFWAGALFVVVQAGMGLALDYWWLAVRFPEGAKVLAQADAQPRPPDVLCLGSSRLGMAFRPDTVRPLLGRLTGEPNLRVFNGTVPNGDLLSAAHLLDRLLDRGRVPSMLVLEVSPETVAENNAWLDLDIIRTLTWSNLAHFHKEIRRTKVMRAWTLSSRLVPVYTHRRRLREVLSPFQGPGEFEQPPDADSGDGLDWTAGIRVIDRLDPATFAAHSRLQETMVRKWLENYGTGGTAGKALKHILRECHQRGISVVLVGAPVADSVRRLYTQAVEVPYRIYLQRVEHKYGCPFADYYDLLPSELFCDGYHVVRAGGQRFSRELAQEVLAPLWLARKGGGHAD